MSASPSTRASLLVRLRDPGDGEAWRQFVQLYAPVVYGYARRRGLQDADAADLTQDVLRRMAKGAGQFAYDPSRGAFRGWLFTVTRNQLLDFQERNQRQRGVGGTSAQQRLEQEPDRQDEAVFDEEFRRRLLAAAAEQVRCEFEARTWEAFCQTAVDGKKPQDVAVALGLSVGAVYIAKSRVQARLKERVRELADESTGAPGV
jgi:RNA polymerase sigma-70 factor (ECF subfamily)